MLLSKIKITPMKAAKFAAFLFLHVSLNFGSIQGNSGYIDEYNFSIMRKLVGIIFLHSLNYAKHSIDNLNAY